MNCKPLFTTFMAVFLGTTCQISVAEPSESQEVFFETLSELCGTRFVGHSVFPEDPGDDWRDKTLVAFIETCTADEIRIPFMVGDDHSRTWIISRVNEGLQLKHDHRHADGTPDEVTMYGGMTQSAGGDLSQSFLADSYTAELIPEASTNVWNLTFSADGATLTYFLERNDLPRFKAVLKKDD